MLPDIGPFLGPPPDHQARILQGQPQPGKTGGDHQPMDNQPSAEAARRPPPRPNGKPRAAGGRLLVCLDSSPAAGQLVRSAGRLAEAARVEWFAVYVETPDAHPTFEDQERIAKTLRLAAQLGGQAVMLSGFSLRDTILDFVREQGVSKIVLAQIRQPGWRRLFSLTLS